MNRAVRDTADRPLDGCTVVVTRERTGVLGSMLDERGATVVHVPLIEIVDVEAPAAGDLRSAIGSSPDWVVVTSAAGAERVGAVADDPTIRLAAVGTATAERLAAVAGRRVDLVPRRQIGASLAESFADIPPARIVVAQADRAGRDLADGLRAAGHDVEVHVAYRTVIRTPTDDERRLVDGSDALVLASGSAAQGWSDAFGGRAGEVLPPIVVAIGPSTAAIALRNSLKVDRVASDHSLTGIVHELELAWTEVRAR